MATPTAYALSYDFTTFQASNPSSPLPADRIEIEFNNLQTTTDEIINNLGLIQRTDGNLANDSVGIEQMKSEVSLGLNTVSDWATGVNYVANDGVYFGSNVYRCLLAHQAGVFATDLAAAKWSLIVDYDQFVSAAESARDAAVVAQVAAELAETGAETAEVNAETAETGAGVAQVAAELARDQAQAAANGMKWRPSVKVGTTGNLTLSGEQTIDGVAVTAGERVLVKDQTAQAENGVYVCSASSWSRADDADAWDDLVSQVVGVEEGSSNADTVYICTVDDGGTLDTTAVVWSAMNGVPSDSIDNAKLANMAADTIKGRQTSSGDPQDLTPTQARAVMDVDSSGEVDAKVAAIDPMTVLTEQVTTSGSSKTFTIPSGAKRVTLLFDKMSTNSSTPPYVRVGDSGGIENTGYVSMASGVGSGTSSSSSTTSFILLSSGFSSASNELTGLLTLVKMSGNKWVLSGAISNAVHGTGTVSGVKTLSDELTTVEFATPGTFDNGSVNVVWE